MLTAYPSSEQPLIDVAMNVVRLGIALVELQWLLSIMQQRMDHLVGEASCREVTQLMWPGVTTHQAGCLFVAGIMHTTCCLVDSNLTALQLEMDPDDVEEVSIELLN